MRGLGQLFSFQLRNGDSRKAQAHVGPTFARLQMQFNTHAASVPTIQNEFHVKQRLACEDDAHGLALGLMRVSGGCLYLIASCL